MPTTINININPAIDDYADRRFMPEKEMVLGVDFLLMEGYVSTRAYEERARKKGKAKKGKNCSKGQVCGMSCISKTRTCLQNMNGAEKAAHNKAKQAASAGGGSTQSKEIVQDSPGRAKMRRLEKKYKEITEEIMRRNDAYRSESDPQKQEVLYQEYLQAREKKAAIMAQVKELKQQGVKDSYEMQAEKEANATYRRLKQSLTKGDKLTRQYMKGTNFDDDPVKAMEQVRNRLIEKSGLSKQDSDELVGRLKIGENINEQDRLILRETASEFYQLTGGKGARSLNRIEQSDPVNGRAFADQSGLIDIGYTRDTEKFRNVVFHEMGHHAEFENRETTKTMSTWIESRATGEVSRLRDLTLKSGYGDDERAYPDKFVDPYVGKVYPSSTEVLSVGIEHFTTPARMAFLYESDKEHFNLIMSAISD